MQEEYLKAVSIMTIKDVMTFKEASDLWEIDSSSLRKLVNTKKLAEGKDFRKSAGTWLITKNAMEKIYGNLQKDQSNDKK